MLRRTNVNLARLCGLLLVLTVSACRNDPLDVKNVDQPGLPRSPKEVETFISKLMEQEWNGNQGATGNIAVQASVMSLESYSALANFGMGARATIPRGTISNSLGNSTQTENFRDYDFFSRNGRSAANQIRALQGFISAGSTTGTTGTDNRALSFAYYNLAYAIAYMALIYDSTAILTPDLAVSDVPPLVTAKTAMTAALQLFDSAQKYAVGMTDIPTGWVSGPSINSARWIQLIRSQKARFRAGVARTPAQRANEVDWNAVIADAAAGITTDFVVNTDVSSGWGTGWRNQFAVGTTWSQMTPMLLGMGDTSKVGDPLGSYADWLAQPLSLKTPFLMRTPDLRFPSGETRTAQQQNFTGTSRQGPPSGCVASVAAARCAILYFRNRLTGEDSAGGDPFGIWYYDNWRFWFIRFNAGNGPVIETSSAEIDLLRAEGLIRTGQIAQAAVLIDKTRTRAGLPGVTGITDLTTQVPGGSACVPRVPQPPTYTTLACGNIFEALKWEKRLETAFTGYAQWLFDNRGWGDLPQGTVLEWPVPWQELSARLNTNFYTTLNSRAGPSTYGF